MRVHESLAVTINYSMVIFLVFCGQDLLWELGCILFFSLQGPKFENEIRRNIAGSKRK